MSPLTVFRECPLRRFFGAANRVTPRRPARHGGRCLTSEVNVHFGVEHAFEGGFHQRAEQTVEVVEGLGLGGNLAGELLGLELEGRVHA